MRKSGLFPRSRLWQRGLLLLLLVIILIMVWHFGFRGGGETGQSAGPGGMPHPGGAAGATTPVQVATVTQADVPVYLSALGTVIPNATVTVTSRVDGQLMKVYFTEGQKVKAGQLLAQIDARSYQATLAQYQAAKAQNEAQLKSAALTLARYRKLFAMDSLSRQDLDAQIATTAQYDGAVKADDAQIAAARLNIEYARITSPIDGRVGLRLVDPGNMVHSSDTTGIVTITQTQPAAVTFSVPQSNLPQLVKTLHHDQRLPVTAFDEDGKVALEQGSVAWLSNQIDTATGTVELKALFDNPAETLYPNQFVNVRVQTSTLNQVAVIPARALQLSSEGSFVFVVNKDNRVSRRQVQSGPAWGESQQAVLSGVKAGEQVVIQGIDRLTDGSKVQVVNADNSQNSAANTATR
ncbi:multidrug transporter subunit MdtA [Erwinia sp. OLTSP20]|uniref:MdtA/MuxA family multidrug efflux RND transporter periplasmic adaptor subunit n=1 Tax=unclassified Erwinia TaxID=2622719 RepID=UPI000C18618D|nr:MULTISPECIES: MdtA/MuxA family multidrug efflux RND transporter periplasmic adaptor subunit [unclassified Erwinia]PIJ49008.1 multidrug transporter subunit MdtA [Erwinia sp. OAMSP11]PIJ75002.1 multidrug transporter subunit MdtA [Erwinia sp. OLSSP12]PIJ79693.1 multidrug transporter subunit MdtA [Erwinia sp. OLCASP19]PIJ80478.1 multidrug transporter subunit MdtA [Erwinia sp. OLMTSP26]PIJ82593.1 multidrug transporter subunit MdtA [Erwinia sp. OLMDSP33]